MLHVIDISYASEQVYWEERYNIITRWNYFESLYDAVFFSNSLSLGCIQMTLVVLKPPQVFSILRCKPVPEIGLDRNPKLTHVNTKNARR